MHEFDIASRALVRTFMPGGSVRGIAAEPRRCRLFVSQNLLPTEGEGVAFDLATGGGVTITSTVPEVQAVAMAGGNVVDVTDGFGVQVRSAFDLARSHHVPKGAGARGLALAPNGRRALVANIIKDATATVIEN